jgi:hypothetical protein
MSRIERGLRRTRASTLDRIACALGEPALGGELARLAGPALAPESEYAERITRRRVRRHTQARRREAARLRMEAYVAAIARSQAEVNKRQAIRRASDALAKAATNDVTALRAALEGLKHAFDL